MLVKCHHHHHCHSSMFVCKGRPEGPRSKSTSDILKTSQTRCMHAHKEPRCFEKLRKYCSIKSTQKEGHSMWSAAKQKYRSIPSFRDVVPPSLHDKHHQSRTYAYTPYMSSQETLLMINKPTNLAGGAHSSCTQPRQQQP